MQIRPYLTFKGECQEAIELYTRGFKTEVSAIMRFSDIPQSPDNPMPIPESQKNWIVQATIPFGDNFMRLSDCIGELNDPPSERVAIVVECKIDEVKHAFNVLSEAGQVGIPLQKTFFSPCHGVVYDKYGVMWNFVAVDESKHT
jgi:PhnB protein